MAKILVVDDSLTIRGQVKTMLTSNGYEVVEASDGLDGLEKIGQNLDVKLIICDVNMPQMDGLTMCQKVRSKEEFKTVPIFMLTTESSPDMKAKGKEIGITAWIIKPFDVNTTLAAVKKVIKD